MTETFWSRFVRFNWEKAPLAAQKADPALLQIDASYIFELLVRYCDMCRERDSLDGLKFYVDGVRLEPFEALEQLPVPSDKSLQGYHRRMSRQFKDYGLVCDELLQVMRDPSVRDAKAWDIVSHFSQNLFQHTGLPNRFAEVGLYLGNYRKTPFGVHVDRCGVFSLPVVGKKTFRTWAPNIVEKNPELKESFSYDEFKSKSQVLVAEPGDITYWPSTHWHIAEGDGSFSATWSIGVWVDRPLTDVVAHIMTSTVQTAITKKLKQRAQVTSLPLSELTDDGFVTGLPKNLSDALKSVSALSEATLKEAFLVWWLEHVSSSGFKLEESPRMRPSEIRIGEVILGQTDRPIYWAKLSKSEIIWACDGQTHRAKATKEIVTILGSLNAGRPVTISSKHSKSAREILSKLCRGTYS